MRAALDDLKEPDQRQSQSEAAAKRKSSSEQQWR
jgi:hypothetical protein